MTDELFWRDSDMYVSNVDLSAGCQFGKSTPAFYL